METAPDRIGTPRRAFLAVGGGLLIVLGGALALIALAGTSISTSTVSDVLAGIYAGLGVVGVVVGLLLAGAARAGLPVAAIAARRRRAVVLGLALAVAAALLVASIALSYDPTPLAPVG